MVPVPSAPPENVSAEAVSSTQILLTWAAVPESEQNGLILGYKVCYCSFILILVFYQDMILYLLFIIHLLDIPIVPKSAGEDRGSMLALKGVIGECNLILHGVTRRNLPLITPHATISFLLCLIYVSPADPLQSKGFGLRTQEPDSEGEPHTVSAAVRPEEVCPV